MRALVAVYTKASDSFKVANRVKEELGADLTRIEAAGAELSGIAGSIMASLGQRAPIKPCRTDLKGYDLLVLCCPAWSKSMPPAVKQYLSELQNTDGKRCAIAVTREGEGAGHAIGKARKLMTAKGLYCLDTIEISADRIANGAYYSQATNFAVGLKTKALMPVAVARTADTAGKAVETAGNAARTAGTLGRFLMRR